MEISELKTKILSENFTNGLNSKLEMTEERVSLTINQNKSPNLKKGEK